MGVLRPGSGPSEDLQLEKGVRGMRARLLAAFAPADRAVVAAIEAMSGSKAKTVVPNVSATFGGVLRRFRLVLASVGLMSGLVNILQLTGSFFMLQVYDRVIPSRSVPTLVALAGLVTILYLFQAALDLVRGRVLCRIALWLDAELSAAAFEMEASIPVAARQAHQPIRDLDILRSFLTGAGPTVFFDLPWMPVYLFICFLFHPAIGWAVVVGMVLLAAMAGLTEWGLLNPTRRAATLSTQRAALSDAARRNVATVAAMGMAPSLARHFAEVNAQYMREQQSVADVSGGLGVVSRFLRMALQSAILGLGAFLVINDQATGGVMIASSIVSSRALAPVELTIANWRGYVAARLASKRFFALLQGLPVGQSSFSLPAPSRKLSVESVSVTAPGGDCFLVHDAGFSLQAGDGLGIIGPSGSGKSCLLRALAGAWPVQRGCVRLDDAALTHWDPVTLGAHIGYLPQEPELFAGTVAQNIARFAEEIDDKKVIAAAQAALVNEMILRLPQGYNTQLGPNGTALSAGQRQRIGLARALYGEPFLVMLDEPNSNLDHEGEQALSAALTGVLRRGGIAVVVAHRPSALASLNFVAVMVGGRIQAFGPKDEVLARAVEGGAASQGALAHKR